MTDTELKESDTEKMDVDSKTDEGSVEKANSPKTNLSESEIKDEIKEAVPEDLSTVKDECVKPESCDTSESQIDSAKNETSGDEIPIKKEKLEEKSPVKNEEVLEKENITEADTVKKDGEIMDTGHEQKPEVANEESIKKEEIEKEEEQQKEEDSPEKKVLEVL